MVRWPRKAFALADRRQSRFRRLAVHFAGPVAGLLLVRSTAHRKNFRGFFFRGVSDGPRFLPSRQARLGSAKSAAWHVAAGEKPAHGEWFRRGPFSFVGTVAAVWDVAKTPQKFFRQRSPALVGLATPTPFGGQKPASVYQADACNLTAQPTELAFPRLLMATAATALHWGWVDKRRHERSTKDVFGQYEFRLPQPPHDDRFGRR